MGVQSHVNLCLCVPGRERGPSQVKRTRSKPDKTCNARRCQRKSYRVGMALQQSLFIQTFKQAWPIPYEWMSGSACDVALVRLSSRALNSCRGHAFICTHVHALATYLGPTCRYMGTGSRAGMVCMWNMTPSWSMFLRIM